MGHLVYDLNPIILRNMRTLFGLDSVLNSQDPNHSGPYPEIKSINREVLGIKAFSTKERLRTLRSLVSPEIKRLLQEEISEVEYNRW